MMRRANHPLLIPALIAGNLLLTTFWGCSMIVDGNFVDPEDAGYQCTGIRNGELCPGSEHESDRLICLFGECVTSRCGDGFVDEGAGEECDDDDVAACNRATCRYHCWVDSDCVNTPLCMKARCQEHRCIAEPAGIASRCATAEVDFGECTADFQCDRVPCSASDDSRCESSSKGTCEEGVCGVDGFCELDRDEGCDLPNGEEGVCAAVRTCEPELEDDDA